MNDTFAYKLKNLEPFSNYTITVVACTSDCSASSDSLVLRTAMSEPSAMLQPTLKKSDDKVIINWKAPKFVGGNLAYYQLKLMMSTAQGNVIEKVFRLNREVQSCTIGGFKCEEETVNFFIRSVNVDSATTELDQRFNNETVSCFENHEPIQIDEDGRLYGEWSQPLTFYCLYGHSMALLGLLIVMAIFLLISVYMLIRFFQKYKRMKDIHIIWPDGLDPSVPISTPIKDSFIGIKDLDLVRNHVLTDIEEEDEVLEREKFISELKPEIVVVAQQVNSQKRESAKSEVFLPFICNPKTNEIFYEMPKKSAGVEKAKSAPTTPQRSASLDTKSCRDLHEDLDTGYMKMNPPTRPRTESATSVGGYLDMSGKSPRLEQKDSKGNNYLMHEIKSFIQESELNNNGYIGKRASALLDPCKKHPAAIINANGYVGLPK